MYKHAIVITELLLSLTCVPCLSSAASHSRQRWNIYIKKKKKGLVKHLRSLSPVYLNTASLPPPTASFGLTPNSHVSAAKTPINESNPGGGNEGRSLRGRTNCFSNLTDLVRRGIRPPSGLPDPDLCPRPAGQRAKLMEEVKAAGGGGGRGGQAGAVAEKPLKPDHSPGP